LLPPAIVTLPSVSNVGFFVVIATVPPGSPRPNRTGSLEHLDLGHGRGIADPAIATRCVEAVDEITRRNVRIAGEAADGKAVPHAAERVLPGNACSQVQRVIELDDTDFVQLVRGQNLNSLRQLLEGYVTPVVLTLTGNHDLFRLCGLIRARSGLRIGGARPCGGHHAGARDGSFEMARTLTSVRHDFPPRTCSA
jgi:hypothetical protein